jgi:hypothetical protein
MKEAAEHVMIAAIVATGPRSQPFRTFFGKGKR